MSAITTELDEHGVRLITLNRPESLNAMTPDMEREYYAALLAADREAATRVVVVTGTGRGFCAGADLSGSVEELVDGGAPLPDRDRGWYPPTVGTPVIAAINGACAGLGLAIALQADVRFVAAEAKLTTAFVKRGLIAEHGTAWLLPRIVGRGRALDLLLSARVFTGLDAGEYGLAEFVAPRERLLADALAYARSIAAECSPRAMAAVKQQVLDDQSAEPMAALLAADAVTRESFTWPDLREGIAAWQEKRPVRFPEAVAPPRG